MTHTGVINNYRGIRIIGSITNTSDPVLCAGKDLPCIAFSNIPFSW